MFPYYFYIIAAILMLLGVLLINNPARFEKFIPSFFSSPKTVIYVLGISVFLFCLFLLIPEYSNVGFWGLIVWVLLCLLLVGNHFFSKKRKQKH